MLKYHEFTETLNAIEKFFRANHVHEHFVKAIQDSKLLVDRYLHLESLVRVDISDNETEFRCPCCGHVYFKSIHPEGYNLNEIKSSPNDNYCINCGKRIFIRNKSNDEKIPVVYRE